MDNYKNKTSVELEQDLQQACIKGDIESVKYLLTSSELTSPPDIDGTMDIVATPPKLLHEIIYNYEPLKLAVEHGQLEIVKYLLTDKELEKNADYTLGYENKNQLLILAAQENKVSIIDFLLTHESFKNEIKIIDDNSTSLRYHNAIHDAVLFESLESFIYFVENKHVDMSLSESFIYLVTANLTNDSTIVKWLIFEYDIEYSTLNKENMRQSINDLFEKRELNKNLNKKLTKKLDEKKELNKKTKI